MSYSDFNAVLLWISNQLSFDDLEKIKFLCHGLIGKKDMEKIHSGSRLFQLLMERGKLGVDNTDYLCKLLTDIQRLDLAGTLQGRADGSGGGGRDPDQTEKAKLNIATEVISQNLGRHWRRVGRKLGLTEVKLDSISRRNPTDLEETVEELLKEWRKSQGPKAQTKMLIEALRVCELNLTADKVEDKLSNCGY